VKQRASLYFLYKGTGTLGERRKRYDVLNRRFEDKIRHLCALATAAKDDDAWLLLSELRVLLSQHIEHLRMVAAAKLSGAAELVERRSNSNSKPDIEPRS
jgi:hypothetical protein